ncbi:MAG: hypothetical protein ACI87E_004385, partial [Mariniblastus sp.]
DWIGKTFWPGFKFEIQGPPELTELTMFSDSNQNNLTDVRHFASVTKQTSKDQPKVLAFYCR